MGTPFFPTDTMSFPPLLPSIQSGTAGKGPVHKADSPQQRVASSVGDGPLEAADELNALVYHAEMRQVALAAEFQKVAWQSSGDEAAEAGVSGEFQQLTFDFFAESRVEEVVFFQERVDAAAAGLEGEQQETFVEASRRVSARFSMSMEVSGVVLNGFAGAAEGLQGDEGQDMDVFLGFVDDMLEKADDILNRIFELLDGFFEAGGDIQDRFTAFLNDLMELELPALSASSDAATTQGSSQAQSFQLQVQLEFSFSFSAEIRVEQTAVQQSDPIVLDLDGDGIELTSYTRGARFDIQGTGQAVTTAFVNGGDAFLALDRNGNGLIDSGGELFGDQHGAANGYEELRKLDANQDGVINDLDPDFGRLLLFRDDGDGQTEDGELLTLAEAGIAELGLRYSQVDVRAAGGNRMAQLASFRRTDGTLGRAGDAILNFVA